MRILWLCSIESPLSINHDQSQVSIWDCGGTDGMTLTKSQDGVLLRSKGEVCAREFKVRYPYLI